MKNPFNKTDRGLRHYEKLCEDLEQKSDNILISLPLFIRIIFTDSSSPWYDEFNRFDLINPLFVHAEFPSPNTISNAIEACLTVHPTPVHVKGITTKNFLSTPFVTLRGRQYTVQDFISSIAYNRGLHNEPDRPELDLLYKEFIESFNNIAFQLTLDIATCFVKSFDDVYKKFKGDSHAFSPEIHRHPRIAINGNLIKDKSNRLTALYSNSYMQLPVRGRKNHGIRICLELTLKITNDAEGVLFQYGHRRQSKVIIGCRLVPGFMLIQTLSRFPKLQKTLRIPISAEHTLDSFWLDVSLYPNGSLVVAVNENIKAIGNIHSDFEIEDGKLIIGSDLQGRDSASFHAYAWTVETIDKRNKTCNVFCAAFQRINPINGRAISPDSTQRPINIARIGNQ